MKVLGINRAELGASSGINQTLADGHHDYPGQLTSPEVSGRLSGEATGCFQINPIEDPRWRSWTDSHPRGSIFHTPEWLEALRRTYGYVPVVFTTSTPGAALTNGIVFCRIQSWLTGAKLVSLPFSDHCEPLVEKTADLAELIPTITSRGRGKFQSVEIRPRFALQGDHYGLGPAGQYWFHFLDLRLPLDELYSRLHKDGILRKIRRAEREHVVVGQGNSELFLDEFYKLLLLTRRRHLLPPQPFSWFRNLAACMGDRMKIYVARVGGRPIAAILTLRHKRTLVYKYGCSDANFHNLGGVPRLFWQAIQDAKSEELLELDLGRSDIQNEGLVRFKDHLGAERTAIKYWQLTNRSPHHSNGLSRLLKSSLVDKILPALPDSLFRLAGEIFYRHAG